MAAVMKHLPEPTPLPQAGTATVVGEDEQGERSGAGYQGQVGAPKPVCRVNELVLCRFLDDPDGLVRFLLALPAAHEQLNAANEFGWTSLMRAARDGLKKHVEALVNAGAAVNAQSTAACREKGLEYPAGSTAADVCGLRHGSLSSCSPQQNAAEILDILRNASIVGEDEDVMASRLDARRLLLAAPNYHSLQLVELPRRDRS